jgi:hypothetical protein
MYKAFVTGDYDLLMKSIENSKGEAEEVKFVSSTAIEYQGDKKYLL